MKEDILEQIAEDFFSKKPRHFTKHNLKFKPSKTAQGYKYRSDSVNSDIDLLVIDTGKSSSIKVVSCKSWQGGFDILKFKKAIEEAISEQPKKVPRTRPDWCHFRELCIHRWSDSFLKVLRTELGMTNINSPIELEYIILCTLLTKQSRDVKHALENSKKIQSYFKKKKTNISLKIVTIDSMLEEIISVIKKKDTPYVENTHLSRTLQLIIASGHDIRTKALPHPSRAAGS